jgi:Family of unknown function (DUF6247)
MSAQPIHESDPDDPVEILGVLPAEFHEQFQAEYYVAAGEAARRIDGYRRLHELLRLWRLRAVAYSDPGYADRSTAAAEGRSENFAAADQVIPGWPGRRRGR